METFIVTRISLSGETGIISYYAIVNVDTRKAYNS